MSHRLNDCKADGENTATSTPPRSSASNISAEDTLTDVPPTCCAHLSHTVPAERNFLPLRSAVVSSGTLEISVYGVVEYDEVNTRPLSVYSLRHGSQWSVTISVMAAATAGGLLDNIAKSEKSWAYGNSAGK